MPLLIADIGGTRSRWALVPGAPGGLAVERLPGFNPASGDPAAMQAGLRQWAAAPAGDGLHVVAYGAGCGAPPRAERMRAALAAVWPQASVEVHSDLLGAARGLFGTASGVVLILGTGMNAGFYDGRELRTPMPSLGYVLGDEGSGADIGKQLLRDALYGRLPGPLHAALFPDGLDLPAVLEQVHRGAAPQAYLASFTGRLAPHAGEAYVQELVAARFGALAALLARFFPQAPGVKASGSVAAGFAPALKAALVAAGLQLAATEPDPLAGLLRFHQGQRP